MSSYHFDYISYRQEKLANYFNFFQKSPKALITLLFMEKYHTIWDDEDPLDPIPIASPKTDSIEEILSWYEKGKVENVMALDDYNYEYDMRHPNCDEQIEKVYMVWEEQLTGNESILEKIILLENVFYEVTSKDKSFFINDLPF